MIEKEQKLLTSVLKNLSLESRVYLANIFETEPDIGKAFLDQLAFKIRAAGKQDIAGIASIFEREKEDVQRFISDLMRKQ